MARLFQEAQQNILRLNQSRLKALSELKAARERINELGKREDLRLIRAEAVSKPV